jgi:hypothetical protein
MVDIASLLVQTCKKQLKVAYVNNSKTELIVRCPYCNDTQRNLHHGHFYISLREPFLFYCQRCETDGILNPSVLHDLSIFDSELETAIYKVNKDSKYKDYKKNKVYSFTRKNLIIPPLMGSGKELKRLEYLNERLGTDYSLEDVSQKFKAILNFKEFILYNKIDTFTESKDSLNSLNKYCIGFLSYDQSTIIFRSLDKEKTGYRYHAYNIFGNYDVKKFYTISSKIDILQPSLNVSIAEGIFDIIGVYSHLYDEMERNNNRLFIAVNGKGYNLVFQYLARLGFLDMNIDIFSDADVNLNFYKFMKNKSLILSDLKIKINYNTLGKDCGTTADNIKLKYSYI